jgi:two-component system chemotaxis response regulator CheY
MTKKVLSLGQCAADQWQIARLLTEKFDVEVIAADRFAEAEARLREGGIDLLLVNRVLDRDGSSGLDFIRRVQGDDALRQVPVMLVSNFADAQKQAISLAALPGFGKAALDEAETLTRLEGVLGASRAM